jgi:hypothetical protein
MKTRMLLIALALLAAVSAVAQPRKAVLNFTPVSCIKSGELGLLQMDVSAKGELRAYFRRVNTTDWCSVEGTNEGPLSRVVLPKFEPGDEIEYFFVLLDGRRVVARSPRMYRSSVNATCEAPFARHVMKLSMNCGQEENAIPSSMGAGYSMSVRTDCVASPDSPDDVPCGSTEQ